jgi:uncharacterized membrane protein YjfL (UPF0719 family)
MMRALFMRFFPVYDMSGLATKVLYLFSSYALTGRRVATSEFLLSLGLWFVRAFVSSLICLLIGYIGIRSITFITTKIKEFESIKGNSLATGLFVGGFFIYAGLVVYGSMVNPFFLSQSVTTSAYFNLQRLLVVIISFFVSLLFGSMFYLIFAKLTPFGIDLDDINKHPVAVGSFLFCYEVFLGLIMLASLTLPIG